MTRFFQVLWVFFALALPVRADTHTPNAPLVHVIEGQIAAFADDDFAAALRFASPELQLVFGTGERFGTMVRSGFPMVYRPDTVTFLAGDTTGDVRHQSVMIRDGAGRVHFLDYEMGRDRTGWHIRGVTIVTDEFA